VFDGELHLSDLELAVTRDLGASGCDVRLLFYCHLLLEAEQRQEKQEGTR
jgi:hypothetical protein